MKENFGQVGGVGGFVCVCWWGANQGTPDSTPSFCLLITARQINAAHLPGTRAMKKDPRTSACRRLSLSWALITKH